MQHDQFNVLISVLQFIPIVIANGFYMAEDHVSILAKINMFVSCYIIIRTVSLYGRSANFSRISCELNNTAIVNALLTALMMVASIVCDIAAAAGMPVDA
jgi:hypothetical protein